MKPYIDTHCHLDRFPNPVRIARAAARRDVVVIAVTNLPSHFEVGIPVARTLPRVRLALGLHPLTAPDHSREWPAFERHFDSTSYVSEVGLDFSREGVSTREMQTATFRRIAQMLAGKAKFVSLHSRKAERAVLEILDEFGVPGAVFHWYTGPVSLVDEILDRGHYFSVNPSMLASAKGRAVIQRLPEDRVLTESDGPFAKIHGRAADPWDVESVVAHLARVWGKSVADIRSRIWGNVWRILRAPDGHSPDCDPAS